MINLIACFNFGTAFTLNLSGGKLRSLLDQASLLAFELRSDSESENRESGTGRRAGRAYFSFGR